MTSICLIQLFLAAGSYERTATIRIRQECRRTLCNPGRFEFNESLAIRSFSENSVYPWYAVIASRTALGNNFRRD